jgi:hypothetical protein
MTKERSRRQRARSAHVAALNWCASQTSMAGSNSDRLDSSISSHPVSSLDSISLTSPPAASDYGTPLPLRPSRKKTTHITRNTTNRSFAIPADAAAIPPKPKTAAIRAIIRKVIAHPNIYISPPPLRNRRHRLIRAPLHCNPQRELLRLITYYFAIQSGPIRFKTFRVHSRC